MAVARALPDLPYWTVPRCWPGECVAILAGGKPLPQEDVDHLRGKCRVIAINRAYWLAPWAEWLWGADADARRFWGQHPDAVKFAGLKIAVRPCGDVSSSPAKWAKLAELSGHGVQIIRHSGRDYPCQPKQEGISTDPAVVRGNNSLFMILSVIQHTGANTVLLLGATMRQGHWHDGYGTAGPDYDSGVIPPFRSLVQPLAAAGIVVLNCAPTSALPWWPKVELRSVLP